MQMFESCDDAWSIKMCSALYLWLLSYIHRVKEMETEEEMFCCDERYFYIFTFKFELNFITEKKWRLHVNFLFYVLNVKG